MKKILAIFLLLLSSSAVCYGGEFEDTVLKGNRFAQKKDYPNAIKEYEAAIKINPKSAKVYLLLGLTYANIDDFEKAIRYSQNSVMIEPSYAAFHNLGSIYSNKGEYEQALTYYEKALKLNPASYRDWYLVGLLHASQAHYPEAIKAYETSIRYNPGFGDVYLGLGSAYYWSGDKEKALKQVSALKSIKMNELALSLQEWIQEKEAKKMGRPDPVKPASG